MNLSSLDSGNSLAKLIEEADKTIDVSGSKELIKYSIRESYPKNILGKEITFFMTESAAKKEAELLRTDYPDKKIWISKIKQEKIIEKLFFEGVDWVSEEEFKSKAKFEYKFDREVNQDTISMVEKFLGYCKEFLKLDRMPTISFLSKREGKMTGGVFDQSNESIKILIGNRCLADVLRSIAHELVHFQQSVQNRIPTEPIPEVGGDIEDEANAVGGQIIKSFCKKDDNNVAYDIYV